MDPQAIYTELRDMRKEATDRHIEVVQRLTALESSQAPIEKIDKRVKSLEGWRNRLVGGIVVAHMLIGAGFAWLMERR